MATVARARFVNPRLGVFFGIFASLFASFFLLMLIFSELGVARGWLELAVLTGPIALYLVFAIASFTNDPFEFFAAGRRVPAVYNGLVLAIATSGGTLLVSGTGLLFLNGYDAWCLMIGVISGFVAMGVLVAPFLRKFGAFTVPTFLGRRLESRLVRIVSAACFVLPMLLILIAELRVGVWLARIMTGASEELILMAVGAVVGFGVLVGGIRGTTWTGSAQAIAVLMATVVLVGIVGVFMTNLPVPQLSSGPVLRDIGRLEGALGVAIPQATAGAFNLAPAGLSPIIGRIAEPFSSVSLLNFIMAIMVLMMGVAAAPWLVPRAQTTVGVHSARKSLSWAIFFFGFLIVTASSAAIFLRHLVMDRVVGQRPGSVPDWFQAMQTAGHAEVAGGQARLSMDGLLFHRDAILLSLPAALDLTAVLAYLILAGALAAVLVAASTTTQAFAALLAEDVVAGLHWAPPSRIARMAAARVAAVGVVGLGTLAAGAYVADPLALVLAALSITAATVFPTLILAIWWQRFTKWGALAALLSGFALSLTATIAAPVPWAIVANPTLVFICALISAGVGVGVAKLTTLPSRTAVERLREMRIPGGETIYDRELRLLRLRQRDPLTGA